MKVMLKLMQGMQELQKQIVVSKDEGKGEEIETLRFAAELPKLQEWNPETVPIDFADWVVCLHAHMSDLDSTSEEWWDLTLSTAKTWYANHLKLTHTQKLTNFPEATQELKLRKWSRLERRASSLLMAALPDSLKEEVVSSKSVTTMGILAKAMLQYQPGRLSGVKLSGNGDFSVEEVDKVEKESPGSWCLHTRVCMKGSGKLVKRIVANHPDLSFRLSLVKSSLMVDTVSTLDTVTQYSEHLLAELEQMSQQARKKDAAAKGQPKLRKMEETPNTKAEEKVRARGKPDEEVESRKNPCRLFLSEAGCKRGRGCPYGHVIDYEKRCWTCGSKNHLANSFPRAEDPRPRAAKMGSKTAEKDSKSTSSTTEKPEQLAEKSDSGSVGGEETMKGLLDEASRMLKSMQESDVKERRQVKENSELKI